MPVSLIKTSAPTRSITMLPDGGHYTVENFHRDSVSSYLSGTLTHGWYALLRLPDGGSYGLSRLDGETDWTADSYIGSNGMPHWVNGYGARYLITKAIAIPSIVAMLDNLADAGDCFGDFPA